MLTQATIQIGCGFCTWRLLFFSNQKDMAEDKKRKSSSSEDKERKHKKVKKEKKEKKEKRKEPKKSTETDNSSSSKQHKHQKQQQRKPSITVQSTTTSPDSAFTQVVAKLYLHLAPMWAANPMEGVTDQLNAFLMK